MGVGWFGQEKKEEVEYRRNLLNSTVEMWGAMVGSIVAEIVGKYLHILVERSEIN